ncbi:MOSC domain-containing protein [Naasia sp. SYSU D00057]|uniref:MOSC domain-containing protein n=1 Tax=Naasia sp. SYSU D00057 TaxID=2817380 RepID=UPI001B30C3D7|nr:MOSC domain-containing protein [Naasia sp. SYSU D00057]
MPSLVAPCVVHALRPDSGSNGVTAIDKRAVDGPVKVGRLGLRADVQANRKHHGGLEKAVYAYSQEDAEFWEAELGRSLPPGWFGENLRVEGIDATAARVGERWQLGKVVLEATMPRTPCMTFARWVGGAQASGWVRRFAAEGRLGAYFRVVHTGAVTAGDPIEVVPAAAGAPTMLEVFRGA